VRCDKRERRVTSQIPETETLRASRHGAAGKPRAATADTAIVEEGATEDIVIVEEEGATEAIIEDEGATEDIVPVEEEGATEDIVIVEEEGATEDKVIIEEEEDIVINSSSSSSFIR